ncbi:MAG: hypothetical protein Q4G05_06305 [Clostridia bacterium]|nr:hypothetical protein [Clostridia bacterium]
MMDNTEKGLMDFGLSQEELEQLEKSAESTTCEGGSEGWSG